jgi:protocatechuate 3,4-dioxygenase beta subunit
MMPLYDRLSRRSVLTTTVAAGSIFVGASQPIRVFAQGAVPTPECRDNDEPTEEQIEGPYFKPRSPRSGDLTISGSRAKIVVLEGAVLTRSCRPVPGALLDLWHADERGEYDNGGFTYRAHQLADASGRYRFRTIFPGPYPGRTRHYHLKVQAPQRPILTTQLYFPREAMNARDGFFSDQLLMRFDDAPAAASARFDFILDLP